MLDSPAPILSLKLSKSTWMRDCLGTPSATGISSGMSAAFRQAQFFETRPPSGGGISGCVSDPAQVLCLQALQPPPIGLHSTEVAFLVFPKSYLDVVEIYRRYLLEESCQRLENVD